MTLTRFTRQLSLAVVCVLLLTLLFQPATYAQASCSAPVDLSISVSPSEGPPGTVVTVSGSSPAGNNISVEGLGDSAQTVSNGSFSVELTASNLTPNCYEIKVTSSPQNGGLGSFTFTRFMVTGGGGAGSGTPNAPAPDLEPTAITLDNAALVAGHTVHFDSGITNSGDADSGVFNIKWFVDGKDVGAYGSHAGVPKNTTVMNGNSQFDWTFDSPGSHLVTFTVDVDNHINESNENNNSRSVTLEVIGPRPGIEFNYPLRGGPPAPPYATYGVANPNLAARPTCFGNRGHYLNQLTHAGEDWFRPAGTPVYPVAAGKIITVVPGWDHGDAIVVEHQKPAQQEWGVRPGLFCLSAR